MKTIRFHFTILGAAAVLLLANCNNGDTSDDNPAGQRMNDSVDDYENTDWNDDTKKSKRHPRSADTVDTKPMP